MIEIIAEIGVNHNGNLNTAKKMIVEAKKSGANTVKFQAYKAKDLALKITKKAPYQFNKALPNESHYQMLKKFELSENDHEQLKAFCEKIKIEYLCTPYDLESLKMLERLKVKKYKTSSADLIDIFLHKFISKTKKNVIISTGMSSFKEITKTLSIYNKVSSRVTLLHCISNYPCSDKSINLAVIPKISKIFNTSVGFSDHSNNNVASIMSVSLGAKVIEKHFTLDRTLEGPDHKASYEPEKFKKYVTNIRKAEIILGKDKKKVQKEEVKMMRVSRKSLVAKRKILKGEKILLSLLTAKRPGTGIYPTELSKVIGKMSKKTILKDEQIKQKNLK